MDLRTKKTLQALRNAFLQLRAQKPLEKITVKELAELAQVSKATFYLHYRDIYDLSEQLQQETIETIYNGIAHPEYVLTAPGEFTRELFESTLVQKNLTGILFEGNQASVLPRGLEQVLRQRILEQHPEFRDSAQINTLLTFEVQGGYYAYVENIDKFELEDIVDTVTKASQVLKQFMV